jgi:hypothetical protein
VVATKTFRLPVSINGPLGYNEGIAIANPNNSNTNVTFKLLLADGTVKDTVQKTLPPHGQTSFVLTDSAVFGHDLSSSTLFNGSVAVCAAQPVGLVRSGLKAERFSRPRLRMTLAPNGMTRAAAAQARSPGAI